MPGLADSDAPSPRPRLNRARVIEAAVAFADRNGLARLSMRNLADDLGVVPMALYKHVAGKEALLDALVDAVVSGFPCPPDDLDWRSAVRCRVLGAREHLLRHPWARQAIESHLHRRRTVTCPDPPRHACAGKPCLGLQSRTVQSPTHSRQPPGRRSRRSTPGLLVGWWRPRCRRR
jgi:AcrR family transcriptional regulator